MIDYAKITVKAGDGGRGSGSFRHLKGKRYGKADGGNGGSGGSVYFVATDDLNSLEPFRYIKQYKAASGENGLSNHRRGADGENLYIKVPIGTQIRGQLVNFKVVVPKFTNKQIQRDYQHGNYSSYVPKGAISFDLVKSGDSVLVARGGNGGRGNSHVRDEYGRRPRTGEEGSWGEELELTLELKLIADVGLTGLPNAGKSTLITALTSAKPKIANYPFTTLEPNLGVLKVQSQTGKLKKLVIADTPGLIEGASSGRGLGFDFLRHVSRNKVLLHLISVESSDPYGDFEKVNLELYKYNRYLARKKQVVVISKVDLVNHDKAEEIARVFIKKGYKPVLVSAFDEKSIENLKKVLN